VPHEEQLVFALAEFQAWEAMEMTLAVKPETPPTPFTCRIGQGDMIMGQPSGETFNYIHGQFIVPTSSWPSSVGSASVWMGLDGCTYPVLLQAGIDFNANDDGPTFYSPWYEWFPSAAICFAHSEFSLQAGNTLEISITATNTTHGNIVLRNISTDLAVTRAFCS
jgi:hypothetical protein